MTVTNAGSLLAEASACRWSQLVFAKRWNELREERSTPDSELLNAFWSVVVLKQHPPTAPSPASSFEADLSFLDEVELEIDKEMVASFVCFLIASGQLSPESVWNFVTDHGGLTKQEHGKVQIDLIGDLLKSLVISLLSLSNETNPQNHPPPGEIGTVQKGDHVLVAKFKLLLSIESSLIASICDFLATHWDFNNQLTCLRLSKWLDVVSIFERSGPLKVFCQFSTPKATAIIDGWRRLQQLALSMAALDRSAIAIKDHLITMSHRWIARSRMAPFFTNSHPSPSKISASNSGSASSGDNSLVNDPEFCSLFCGAVDYLYALEFGSNINRFSSSEFVIPLLRSVSLSMTLFVAPSNTEPAITQQLTSRYVPLLNHVATSMGVQGPNLFELIEHAAKTSAQQPPSQPQPVQANQTSTTAKKIAITNFVDSRPNYLLRVFQSCRLSCLAKALNVPSYNGQFVSELITNACRDMNRGEFEEFVGRDLLKNLHVAPFLTRTEITRLQLVLGERASKEESHLALALLAAVDLFKCYLITRPGVDLPNEGAVISEGAVGSFLENIINKRIKNFATLIMTTDDDDGCDHHQDDNDGHLPDLDLFMSTLPDSVAESVGIGLETTSRLLFLLGKTDSARVAGVVRRLVLANHTLAFILWLLVDEKLRRRQVSTKKERSLSSSSSAGSADSPAPKRRKSDNSLEMLLSINETLKNNINSLKSPFNGVYSLLFTLSAQVRSLALVNRNANNNNRSNINNIQALSNDPVFQALRHPGLLNHYLVMREIALPDGTFKSGEATAQSFGALFSQVLSSSGSHLSTGPYGFPGASIGVDTSEGYRNFLAFSLPLIAGLDAETLQYLFRKWFSNVGHLATSLLSSGCQLSFIVAAQVWNFSFFLVLLTMSSQSLPSDEIKQIVSNFFTNWHRGLFGQEDINKKERFRFVAVEMFFAELMFFANINICRLVASSLPTDFILNFVTSSAPPPACKFSTTTTSSLHGSSVTSAPSNRLLQLKRRVIGRLFALDENNRFDEDFCIRAVCSLSPFESL